jgi:hypothetical protein
MATTLFIVGIFLLILAFDVWVWRMLGIDATITRVTQRAAEHVPLLPYLLAFAMGALFGHLFL